MARRRSDEPKPGSGTLRWFKMYSEVLNDRKIQSLPGDLLRAWLNLLCIANENPRRGYLPATEDLAFALRVSDEEAERMAAELLKRGLLDRDDDGSFRPHNWDGRQAREEKSTDRVRRHREKVKAKKEAEKQSVPPNPPPQERAKKGVEQNGTCSKVPETERCNKNGTALDKNENRDRGRQEESPSYDVDSAHAADVDDDDDQPEQDSRYLKAAERAGYQVVSRGHRKTIEHTRELFGDAQAVAVGNNGMRIHQALGGGWHFFRASAENLKRSGKSKNDYVGAVLFVATQYRSTGIPPAPVPVDAAPEATHPRVYRADDAPARLNSAQANQKSMRNAFSKVNPDRLKDIP